MDIFFIRKTACGVSSRAAGKFKAHSLKNLFQESGEEQQQITQLLQCVSSNFSYPSKYIVVEIVVRLDLCVRHLMLDGLPENVHLIPLKPVPHTTEIGSKRERNQKILKYKFSPIDEYICQWILGTTSPL